MKLHIKPTGDYQIRDGRQVIATCVRIAPGLFRIKKTATGVESTVRVREAWLAVELVEAVA